jgi:hypothetical protein
MAWAALPASVGPPDLAVRNPRITRTNLAAHLRQTETQLLNRVHLDLAHTLPCHAQQVADGLQRDPPVASGVVAVAVGIDPVNTHQPVCYVERARHREVPARIQRDGTSSPQSTNRHHIERQVVPAADKRARTLLRALPAGCRTAVLPRVDAVGGKLTPRPRNLQLQFLGLDGVDVRHLRLALASTDLGG